MGALQGSVGRGGLLAGRTMSDDDLAASGECLRGRQTCGHADPPGSFGDITHAWRGEHRVHQRDGLRPQFRLVPERGLQRELWQMDDGEHGLLNRGTVEPRISLVEWGDSSTVRLTPLRPECLLPLHPPFPARAASRIEETRAVPPAV